jgi:hypothetical protein
MKFSLLLVLLVGVTAVVAYPYVEYGYDMDVDYNDYDYDGYEVMGAARYGLGLGYGGFGYGGLGAFGAGGGKKGAPVALAMVQPVQQNKKVQYAQPIVTYAQPIVQPVNMQQPIVQTKQMTAQPIIQPTFQTAPLQTTQAISATAPTIQKGFGTNVGLGHFGRFGGY